MLAMEDGGGLARAEQAWGALQLVPVGCGRLWVRAPGSRWCDPLRRGGFLGRRPDRRACGRRIQAVSSHRLRVRAPKISVLNRYPPISAAQPRSG